MQQPEGMPIHDESEPVAPTHPDPATLAKESTAEINGQPVQVTTLLRTDDLAGDAAIRVVETERPANLASDGRVHFLRNVDGEETCGACGTPWPCDRQAELRANAMHLTGKQAPQAQEAAVTRDEMATLMNMSRAELDQRLLGP